MQLTFSLPRLAWLGGVVALMLLVPALPAQVLPPNGEKALEDDYYKHRITVRALLVAQEDPTKVQDAVATLAKYHVYRYTWSQGRDPGKALQLMKEFNGDMDAIVRGLPGTGKLQIELTKQIVAVSEEMFTNREPLARVNYARILARLGKDGMEEVFDPLTKAIKDEQQIDGVKYWAFVGLRQLFACGHVIEGRLTPPQLMKNKKAETEAILALIAFINRTITILPGTPSDEVEGLRVLRREAVAALALSRHPAVLDDKKEVAGRTAQTLMRVIAGEGFTPAVQLDEKVEAAVGLCRMPSVLYPDYQPDAAARYIGLAVVDLANGYSNDNSKGREHGWKVKAARLSEGLAVLKAEMLDKKNKHLTMPTTKYVSDMIKDAEILVRQVEKNESAVPANFNNWLRSTPPPSETVYKNLADSIVKFPEPPNE